MNTNMPSTHDDAAHHSDPAQAGPYPVKFLMLYRRLRSQLVHAAADADDGTMRATLAYLALWLLASLSAVAYVTHLSSLFR